MRRLACITLAAATLICGPALAQIGAKKTPPPATPPAASLLPILTEQASKDPKESPAGTYTLDPNQTAVILRIGHANGFSFSVFRMGSVAGVLAWDPENIEKSRVRVTVDAASLQTNVAGFALQLTGPDFLNAKMFPDATFVSTGIRQTGPTTGLITGNFTLHGVTKPLVLETELVGAGTSLRGPALGFHARATFHRLDFGVGPVSPVIGDEVEMIIDLEFDKAPAR